jgi:hypothetical protein
LALTYNRARSGSPIACQRGCRLPQDARRIAIDFTCNALGQSLEPTGIKFTPDRQLRHLYWDRSIDDIYNRLVHLVITVGLKEQLVVQGAAAFIQTHFALWGDPENSDQSTQGFVRNIEMMQAQLALPINARDGRRSDDQIHAFIGKLEQLVESAETRRGDAEATMRYLQEEFSRVFTLELWNALNHLEVERLSPQIDDLLNREDNPDDDE